jgi:hypothetical protein
MENDGGRPRTFGSIVLSRSEWWWEEGMVRCGGGKGRRPLWGWKVEWKSGAERGCWGRMVRGVGSRVGRLGR